jgi:hypothetical protein
MEKNTCLEDHAAFYDAGDVGNVHSRFGVGNEP